MQFINIIYIDAGLKGQSNRRLISMAEVKKHQTEGQMWTVLKGRVYNISPYMKFHPGGTAISSICKFIYSILFFLLLISLKLYMHFGKIRCWYVDEDSGKRLHISIQYPFCYFPIVLFEFVRLFHSFVSINLMLPFDIELLVSSLIHVSISLNSSLCCIAFDVLLNGKMFSRVLVMFHLRN